MKKILFIAVMMLSVFCFSQNRYSNSDSYGNIRYESESFENRSYVPLELAKRHENNRKRIKSLKKWILEVKPQMINQEYINRLDLLYDLLEEVENKNLTQDTQIVEEAEKTASGIVSKYNTWLTQEREKERENNSSQNYLKKLLTNAFEYSKKKEYTQAIINFSKYLEEDKNNTDVIFFRALAKSRNKDNEGAIADYDKILELHSNYPLQYNKIATVYNNKAFALVELEEYSEALPLVNKALELDKTENYIWDTRGEIYYHMGEYDKCIEDMDKAIAIGENEHSYYIRGLAYIKLNNKSKACADLLKASELGNSEATQKRKEFCN